MLVGDINSAIRDIEPTARVVTCLGRNAVVVVVGEKDTRMIGERGSRLKGMAINNIRRQQPVKSHLPEKTARRTIGEKTRIGEIERKMTEEERTIEGKMIGEG